MNINKLHGCIHELPEAIGNFIPHSQKKVIFGPEHFLPDYVMRCFILEPQTSSGDPHQHAWPHWMVILNGQAHFFLDGKTFIAQAGDWIYVPSDIEHCFKNGSQNETLEILCMVPPEGDVSIKSMNGCCALA